MVLRGVASSSSCRLANHILPGLVWEGQSSKQKWEFRVFTLFCPSSINWASVGLQLQTVSAFCSTLSVALVVTGCNLIRFGLLCYIASSQLSWAFGWNKFIDAKIPWCLLRTLLGCNPGHTYFRIMLLNSLWVPIKHACDCTVWLIKVPVILHPSCSNNKRLLLGLILPRVSWGKVQWKTRREELTN